MEDYEQICPTCGRIVDKRNPAVLAHGNWNEDTKQFECYDVDGNIIPFTASMIKGDSVQWTADKKRIDLN